MKKTYIIAEAGVNHNGSLKLAKELVIEAKKVGADCVKFQTFKAEQLVTAASPKAQYQLEVTDQKETQYEMLKKLELKFEDFKELLMLCQAQKIDFLSTPYNKEDADMLDEIGVFGYKIASGQLTELPFLKYVARKKKTMIVSTGMSTMDEVRAAVDAVRSVGNDDIVILQCTTNYPSREEDANLRAMNSMKEAAHVRVGYSDHTTSNYACFAAVALGAEMIEKHFTLDQKMEGPDHSSSLNPAEFKELVTGVRLIEKAMGTGIKVPSEAEKRNIYGMKRSLVVLKDLPKGTVLTEDLIGFKRPLNGLAVNYLDQVIGKKLEQDMKKDEPIQMSSIAWK